MILFRHRMFAYFLFSVLGLSIGTLPSIATAEEYQHNDKASLTAKVFDAVVVRPIMVPVTVLSAGVFVVSLPFTATGIAGGSVAEARKVLLTYPVEYTFLRPLGDF